MKDNVFDWVLAVLIPLNRLGTRPNRGVEFFSNVFACFYYNQLKENASLLLKQEQNFDEKQAKVAISSFEQLILVQGKRLIEQAKCLLPDYLLWRNIRYFLSYCCLTDYRFPQAMWCRPALQVQVKSPLTNGQLDGNILAFNLQCFLYDLDYVIGLHVCAYEIYMYKFGFSKDLAFLYTNGKLGNLVSDLVPKNPKEVMDKKWKSDKKALVEEKLQEDYKRMTPLPAHFETTLLDTKLNCFQRV